MNNNITNNSDKNLLNVTAPEVVCKLIVAKIYIEMLNYVYL